MAVRGKFIQRVSHVLSLDLLEFLTTFL